MVKGTRVSSAIWVTMERAWSMVKKAQSFSYQRSQSHGGHYFLFAPVSPLSCYGAWFTWNSVNPDEKEAAEQAWAFAKGVLVPDSMAFVSCWMKSLICTKYGYLNETIDCLRWRLVSTSNVIDDGAHKRPGRF